MSQFLIAVGGSTTSGGNVGTTELRLRLIDAIRINFDGENDFIEIKEDQPGYGADYDPTVAIIDELARTIVWEVEMLATRMAQRLPESVTLRPMGPQWAFNVHMSLGDSGGGVALASVELGETETTTSTLSQRILDGVRRAQTSDEANALNRFSGFRVLLRPHTGSYDSAGCELGVGDCSRHLFNPPEGECLVWCLLHHVRASEGAKSASKLRENAANFRSGKLRRSTVFEEFKRRLLECAEEGEPDWCSPDEVMELFYKAGYKLEIHIEFGPEAAEEGLTPLCYGIQNGWPVAIIVRREWHFYAVINAERYREDIRGKSRHEYVQMGEHGGYAPATDAPSRKRAKLVAEEQDRCTYCDRTDCKREGGKGRTAGVSVCVRCGRQPRSLDCAARHAAVCQEPIRCRLCNATFSSVRLKELHACRATLCSVPNCNGVGRHVCLLEPIKSPPPVPEGFVAYDLESAVTEDGYHRPVCVCVSWITFPPEYVENLRTGAEPGPWMDLSGVERQRERYVGDRAIFDFAEDLIENDRWKHHVVAAHNGARYDARLLTDAILQLSLTQDLKPVIDGTAIKCIRKEDKEKRKSKSKDAPKRFPLLYVIDTFTFITMSLRKAAEAYGARDSKTFFSFTKLNEWYEMGMKEDAVISNPKKEDYPRKDWGAELDAHIAAREGKPFKFVEELLEYCMADVDVLLDVMINFHTLFARIVYELSKKHKPTPFWTSPFCNMTLASAAFNTFKMAVYDKERFPLCTSPPAFEARGWAYKDMVTRWLCGVSEQRRVKIEGAKDGKIVKLEGTTCSFNGRAGKEFFELLACKAYGCSCISGGNVLGANTIAEDGSITVGDKQADLRYKIEEAEKRGYTVTTIKLCELKRKLREPEFGALSARAYERCKHYAPLAVRSAYKGGRVEPFFLLYRAKEDEILRSFDVVSLYPSVMTAKYNYPLGKPKILRACDDPEAAQEFAECVRLQSIGRYFGLIRCKVLVDATRLHHPLVHRHHAGTPDEKLLAGACFTCGERTVPKECEHKAELFCKPCLDAELQSCPHVKRCWACCASFLAESCTHDEEQRAFWIESTTEEVKLALEEGDRILDISEVHHFEKRGNQFGDYIFELYKTKQRASKFPSFIENMPEGTEKEAAKLGFCAELDKCSQRVFGRPMELTPDQIEFNEGLRQTAKLTLNSFYGKFGTNPERNETCFIKTFEELKKITSVKEGSEKLVLDFIVTGEADEPVTVGHSATHSTRMSIEANSNVYIAAFVTAYGRIKLYKEALKKYQGDALYCDTDSIFVRMKKTDPIPPSDGFLGTWDHEGEKDSTAFASLGPKVYVMQCTNGKNKVKAKGIKVGGTGPE